MRQEPLLDLARARTGFGSSQTPIWLETPPLGAEKNMSPKNNRQKIIFSIKNRNFATNI